MTGNRRHFLSVFVPCGSLFMAKASAKEKRYRLTLVFSDPSFKWSRVIEYRDDFHLFLEASPFPTVKGIIFVAGTVYPKDGADHASIKVGTSLTIKEIGELLGEARHVKLPKNGQFEIPPVGGHYKSCKAHVEFLP